VNHELNDEARSLVAATRGWLAELHEEGVESFERVAAAAAPAQSPAPVALKAREVEPPEPTPHPPPPAIQPSLVSAGPDFGPSPTLEHVREVLGECTRCRLSEGRGKLVFGDGNPNADLLFVGEGPGAEEDKRGLPFVGRAGELLTTMIEKGLEIPRSDVYICNIVKCRAPDNRTPLADEVTTCQPFLDAQIAAVKPKVIVALGKPATSLLLGREVAITRMRGTWHDYKGIPLMPTLHPAFILRQYTPENRRAVWSDLKAALARCSE
jgi:DNA polymerase